MKASFVVIVNIFTYHTMEKLSGDIVKIQGEQLLKTVHDLQYALTG